MLSLNMYRISKKKQKNSYILICEYIEHYLNGYSRFRSAEFKIKKYVHDQNIN